MKFFNKTYFTIWAIAIIISLFIASTYRSVCPHNFNVNEELLIQNCGVTPEQFRNEVRLNSSFCPEGGEALGL